MDSFARAKRTQQKATKDNVELLVMLAPSRTATLLEVLNGDREALGRIGGEWIDIKLFRERFARASAFLSQALRLERGFEWAPFMFFQRNDAQEDEAERRKRIKTVQFRFEPGVPLQAAYLHTHTSFIWKLDKTQDGLVIPPLHHFASWKDRIEDSGGRVIMNVTRMTLGYRLPNLPQLLGVSPRVATEYLARQVVHDFGHGILPHVPNEWEELHNAAMIAFACGFDLPQEGGDLWERIVALETTDPLFFLRAKKWIKRYRRKGRRTMTPLQSAMLKAFAKWHLDKKLRRLQSDAWLMLRPMTQRQKARQARKIIRQLPETAFKLYAQMNPL